MLWPDPLSIPELSDHQREIVSGAMLGPVWILTGGPGTGKTYVIAAIIKAIAERHGLHSIGICSPTGLAALRCTVAMQKRDVPLSATTIHRMLGVTRGGHDGNGWGFSYGPEQHLPFQFIIADEQSMSDVDIAAALFSACATGTHVLISGDIKQLPSVGHGAMLRDLLRCLPSGELTEVQRNGGDIVRVCQDINLGKPYVPSPRVNIPAGLNVKHWECSTPAASLQRLRALLSNPPPGLDPVWDVQVLCPTNGDKDSDLGRRNINRILQDVLNPAGERIKGNPFRVGDKVICTSNSMLPLDAAPPTDRSHCGDCGSDNLIGTFCCDCGHDGSKDEEVKEFVANGEIGRVERITAKMAFVRFDCPARCVKVPLGGRKAAEDGDGDKSGDGDGDAGEKESGGGTGSDFELAYAITTHKSQGSQFPVTIILIDGSRGASQVCSLEWWTTAFSRAEKLDITIGRRADVNRQCKVRKLPKRKTFLRELMVS